MTTATGLPRIPFLDMLRGIAVLGILVMNIQGFAQVELAYINPYVLDALSPLEQWLHAFGYLFIEQKFVSLFSMMFGISTWIVATNAHSAGSSPTSVHLRRNLGLLIIGLVHAYLIWSGDILVSYAVTALLLTPALHWSIQRQIKIGLLFFAIPLIFSQLQFWLFSAEERAEWFAYTPEQLEAEIAAYRGGWLETLPWRLATSRDIHLLGLPFVLVWFVGGWMLTGMALFRIGIARAMFRPKIYWVWSIAWLIPGLILTQLGYLYQAHHQFELHTVALGRDTLAYLGALMMTNAYLGFAVLFYRSRLWPKLVRALEAIGRMALTNYLTQSLVATFLFHGFGLGWFERLSLVELVPVTLGIWAVNLMFSVLWLRYFRQGPMEWAWRHLTQWSGASRFP